MTTTPTIDGTATGGEWDDASSTTISAYCSLPISTKQVFFYAKNNATFLFLRLQWQDTTHCEWFDILEIHFDETNSGNWHVEYNNAVSIYANSTNGWGEDRYIHYESELWWVNLDIASLDGAYAITYNDINQVYTAELAIPLGSTDPDDMAATAGSLIGIHFSINDGGTGLGGIYEYPNGTDTVSFQLATASSGIGITIWPLFFLALSCLVVLDIVRKHHSNLVK